MPATNFQQILDPISQASDDIARGVSGGLFVLDLANNRDYAQQFTVVLEGAKEKFQEWSKIWMKKASGPDLVSEWFWGKRGREDIRMLLETAASIANMMVKRADLEFAIQPSLMSKMVAFVQPQRKNEVSFRTCPDLGDLAMQLSQTVNVLRMYSQFVFDSRNAPRDPIILESVKDEALEVRRGFIALYQQCRTWNLNCSLELNVERFHRDHGTDDAGICSNFRLLAMAGTGDCPSEDIELDVMYNSGQAAETLDADHFDLASLLGRGCGEYIRLKSNKDDIATLIKLSEGPATYGESPLINLSLPLSRKDKICLAFGLVETGYYLLGTPWLASLSLKTMRRLGTGDGGGPYQFFLDTKEMGSKIANRTFAVETDQLFNIGIILMKIARDKQENLPKEGRELEIAKRLLELKQAMGPEYCKATAYCLLNRKPPMILEQLAHDQLRKYEEPGLSDWWKLYLPGFLQSYYTQVYLPYVSYTYMLYPLMLKHDRLHKLHPHCTRVLPN